MEEQEELQEGQVLEVLEEQVLEVQELVLEVLEHLIKYVPFFWISRP